jgi:hypothetical protein
MRLEVIADDVYFEPWSSQFNVKTNKKVNVMVAEQVDEKPKLKVQVMEQPQEEPKPRIVETKKSQPKSPTKVEITKEELLKRLMK